MNNLNKVGNAVSGTLSTVLYQLGWLVLIVEPTALQFSAMSVFCECSVGIHKIPTFFEVIFVTEYLWTKSFGNAFQEFGLLYKAVVEYSKILE